MRTGLVQHANSDDYEQNLKTSISGIEQAAREGAQLVLLQELHTSLYFCNTQDPANFELAESIPGPTTEKLSATAGALDVVIVGSVFERRAAGIYHNTAVVIESDGRIAGIYRKMHIPDDPGYYEKYYFTPGDLGFTPIDTSLGRLGVLVCWDQWFPEAARVMALAGAELLLYPSAIGWDPKDTEDEQARQYDAWRTIQRAHAIANGLPLLCCNRVGLERDPSGVGLDSQFWGGSFACGPQGEIVAQAPHDERSVLVVDIDLTRTASVRHSWPYLRDRRIDAYQDMVARYRDR
ncbi:MAG: carbon-nitrogen hydrolase [Gammaproteobacteria bacterium]|nr:carbon-nitrogen hydrolase [Gammaproteobacteria bacterium]